MSRFAFSLSLVDMIRKLRYKYEEPIDYADNFISRMYGRDSKVDVLVSEDCIRIESSRGLDESFLESIANRDIMAVASVIPPTDEYREVEIACGSNRVRINENREILTDKVNGCDERSVLEIARQGGDLASEIERLKRLYNETDIELSINGKSLAMPRDGLFSFEKEGIEGAIRYNPYSEGALHFFKDGRHVSDQKFARGIEVFIYKHPFPTTITKSKVITGGRKSLDYERLKGILSGHLREFMESEKVKDIKMESEGAYQTMLRSALFSYPADEQMIRYVQKNIRFAGRNGRINPDFSIGYLTEHPKAALAAGEEWIYQQLQNVDCMEVKPVFSKNDESPIKYRRQCLELKSMVDAKDVVLTGNGSIHYSRGVLFIPELYFESKSVAEMALLSVPEMRTDEKGRLRLYGRIVDQARK